MRTAEDQLKPVLAAGERKAFPVPQPLAMTREEIAALCNAWPNRQDAAIIPGKVHKQQKRVLLPIAPDYELDQELFRETPKAKADKIPFIHAGGGRELVPVRFRTGARLYVNEPVEVIDRPEGESWVRIKYRADDEVRMILFEEGEVRPKMGMLRFKELPVRFARGDRMVVRHWSMARLWDMTEEDARREGAFLLNQRRGTYSPNASYLMGFETMWDELHRPQRPFSGANWWVQVLELVRDFDE